MEFPQKQDRLPHLNHPAENVILREGKARMAATKRSWRVDGRPTLIVSGMKCDFAGTDPKNTTPRIGANRPLVAHEEQLRLFSVIGQGVVGIRVGHPK